MNGDEPASPASRRVSRRLLLRGGVLAAAGTAAVGGAALAADRNGLLPAVGDAAHGDPMLGPTWHDPRLGEARVVWRVHTDRRLLALTFDDGPVPDYTTAVLDSLRKLGVRATFNLVGSRAVAHRELLRREVDEGHEHGNHTYSHADLAKCDRTRVRSQLHRAHDVITRLAGTPPRSLRPPYGHVTGDTLVAAAELGYDVIAWSVKFHEEMYDAAHNADYIVANLSPGAVILAHDTGNKSRLKDVQALPRLVAKARDAGYEFVTVSELLAAAR